MEILAPAGNIDSLKAAVHSGADAVYLGVGKYNARAKADNFTLSNIAEWVEYCHFYSCKVYLAINTNMYDNELGEVAELISIAAKSLVDALIIADMAVAKLAYEIAPHIPRHASTQMGVHNVASAKLAEKLGFSRVILARETLIADIIDIKKHCNLEIEYFIQGALCVSFSGGCLLSALSSGNSGNRGGCLQPCRKQYSNTINGESAYYLSAKDQNIIQHIAELREAGVNSVKIEGRMRSAEYVASACRAIKASLCTGQLGQSHYNDLAVTFNRGNYTEGYNYENPSSIIYSKHQGHIGLDIGVVERVTVDKNKYTMYVRTNNYIIVEHLGIKIMVDGEEHDGFMLDNIAMLSHNEYAITHYGKAPSVGARINITRDDRITTGEFTPLAISFNVKISQDFSMTVSATCDGLTHNETIENIATVAQSSPIKRDGIIKKFNLSNNSRFCLGELVVDNQPEYFVPISAIVAMRDRLITAINTDILQRNIQCMREQLHCSKVGVVPLRVVQHNNEMSSNADKYVIINYSDYDRFKGVNSCNIILNYDKNTISTLKSDLNEKYIYIKLPKTACKKDLSTIYNDMISMPDNVLIYADSLYSIEIALELNRDYIVGAGLNIFNKSAEHLYGGVRSVVSIEMSIKDGQRIDNSLVYSYGTAAVMTLAHCPYGVATGKSDCKGCKYVDFAYKDKYGEYPIRRLKMSKCYFTLYNSKCHYLLDKVKQNRQLIDLTISTDYNIIDNELIISKPVDYTRGHANK